VPATLMRPPSDELSAAGTLTPSSLTTAAALRISRVLDGHPGGSEAHPLGTWIPGYRSHALEDTGPLDPGEVTEDDLWFVGVLVTCFVSTLAGTLGKHCFRRAALVTSKSHMAALYCLGIGFTLLEPPGDALALSLAPMAIVTSCSGMTLVWNTLLAPCTLGESITRVRLLAAGIVLLGTIGVGCFGPHSHRDRTAQEYLQLFSTQRALVYYSCLTIWLLVAGRVALMQTPGARLFGAAFAGTLLGNNIMTKVCVQLVKCSVQGASLKGCGSENPLHRWEIYVFFLAAATLAFSGVLALTLTLRSSEALDAITVFQGSLITFGALSSFSVLNEQRSLDLGHAVGYLLSLGIIVSGLAFLTMHEAGILRCGCLRDGDVHVKCYDKMASTCRTCLDRILGDRPRSRSNNVLSEDAPSK